MEQLIVTPRTLSNKLLDKLRVTRERGYVDWNALHDGMTATTTVRRVASQYEQSP